MNLTFEENKLKNYLGKELVKLLQKYNMFIAGGAITSIFTNRKINDIDVYARNEDDMINFLEEFWDKQKFVICTTDKATQFAYNKKVIQTIYFKFFNNPYEIFDSFDFTVCMAAYDFKDNKFYFHEDFLKHNLQRILRFNSNTAYPIVSALRVKKYEDKGYRISKAEFVKVIMTCMKLNITSYDELIKHLGGMYGVDMSKAFENLKDEVFDLQKAIDILSNITYTDEYFETEFEYMDYKLEDILDKISPNAVKYVDFNGKTYRVYGTSKLKKVYGKKIENHRMLDIKEVLKDNKLYKFVYKNSDGEYVSYYDSNFKYRIGEIAEAKGEIGKHLCDHGKLHFNQKEYICNSTYFNEKDKVLLEVRFDYDDLLDIEGTNKITARKVYVVREVPEEEWKQWIN